MSDKLTNRSNASALIPEEAATEIIKAATQSSRFLSHARQLRRMTRKEMRMPVMTLLPEAYFVGEKGVNEENGTSALKKTTKAMWSNKFINAEEMAVIIPIPEAVLDDSAFDIWGEITPYVGEAFGTKLDRAILWGEDAPQQWPTNVASRIVSAGNAIAKGTNLDLYSDLLGVGGAVASMEEAGYSPSGYLSQMGMRAELRDLRDSDDRLLFKSEPMQQGTTYFLDGEPIEFPRNGSMMPDDWAYMFAMDWQHFVYSVRTDMQMKLSSEAVISDTDGNVVLNLYQEDCIAARFTWRLGWQVSNPPTRLKPDTEGEGEADPYTGNLSRYPAAALVKTGYAS